MNTMIKFLFDVNRPKETAWRIHIRNTGDLESIKVSPSFKRHYREALKKRSAKYGLAVCQVGSYLPIKKKDQILESRECMAEEVW